MGNTSSNDEVKLFEQIGTGSYAEVYRAVWRRRNVAAKKLYPYILNKAEALKYTEDWKLLSKLEHPNIVQYLTVVWPDKSPRPNESMIIVTELLDQDLRKFINNSPKVSFHDTVSILLDVAQGLNYLHEPPRSIVHRDLACKNILLTVNKQAKIADFGLAKCFPDGEKAATANLGTPANQAPETFGKYCWSRARTKYGPKADVFSFGVVALEVIIGHPSIRISDLRTEDGGKLIPECYRRSEDLNEIDSEHPLRVLVLHCLEDDPEDRPTAFELVKILVEHKNNNDFHWPLDSLEKKQTIHRMPCCKYDYEFKIVLVGDNGVGKTSITTKFVRPNVSFQERMPPTIPCGEFNERLQLKGKSVFLQIVDTAGQFNTTSSIPQFYRGAHGAAVVFDVASWDSLVSVRQWVSMVRDKCAHDIPIILVGNKTDCKRREVDTETAEKVRDEFNLFYIEVSAKTGENIDETFSVLIEQLMLQRDEKTLGGATSEPVTHRPSTSLRNYEHPAKFAVKEPTQRKRIEKDADTISLKSEGQNWEVVNRHRTNYGSINTSTDEKPTKKRRSCCLW